jgi:hypothetical protein
MNMTDSGLHIDRSKRTPMVYFDNGKMIILGRSIIENPSEFYAPVFNWLLSDLSENDRGVEFYFAFEHINTGSVKWLFVLLKDLFLDSYIKNSSSITWIFDKEDDDMQELGYVFRTLVSCKFTLTPVDTINDEIFEKIIKS